MGSRKKEVPEELKRMRIGPKGAALEIANTACGLQNLAFDG
jgi:hypothetical protein